MIAGIPRHYVIFVINFDDLGYLIAFGLEVMLLDERIEVVFSSMQLPNLLD